MRQKAEELIRKYDIKNVICSGPYHRASYYTVLLKKDLPDLNVIIDFRDRWTDGEVYGLESVPDKVYKKEEALQRYTCEHADIVISTYDQLLKELKALYPHLPAEKFIHFPHNYDADDYEGMIAERKEDGKIRMIYGGTINTAAFNDGIRPFLSAFGKMRKERKDLFDLFDITFYGENYKVNELIKDSGIAEIVVISPKIGEKEFYSKAAESDFLLLFLGSKWKDLVTTKSITYLPFKRPMVIVAKEGAASRLVTDNSLGYHVPPDRCYDKLVNLAEDYLGKKVVYNTAYDFREYSYEKAAGELIPLLK